MRNNIASRWRRALVLVGLGALLVACGDGVGEPDAAAQPSPPAPGVGQATATTAVAEVELAPELVGLDEWVNSKPLTLEQLRGEPVLIVFWASW
jgi:hypothetical protein